MRAAVRMAHDPDCSTRCPMCRSAEHRRVWGCDEPKTDGLNAFRATCSECDGFDEECSRCEGTGVAEFPQCPGAYLKGSPWVSQLLSAFRDLDCGVLPAPGGMNDQAAFFVEGIRLVRSEIAVIGEEQRIEAERKARARK